jgi:hypothetical protein
MTDKKNWEKDYVQGKTYAFKPTDSDNLTNFNELCAYVAFISGELGLLDSDSPPRFK